jgi:tetratricopeptide (TPR) repeat protein
MSYQETQKQKQKQTLPKLNNFCAKAVKYGGIFGGAVVGLGTVYAFCRDYLDTDILPLLHIPLVTFAMIALIVALIAVFTVFVVDYLNEMSKLNAQITGLSRCEKENEELKSQATNLEGAKRQLEDQLAHVSAVERKNDSILDMLACANQNQQYREVIKIGTALGDVLWTTSRKDLRIKVGEHVRAAAHALAQSSGDKADVEDAKLIEAKTLIEDIGNTQMCLNKSKVDIAIKSIRTGIGIAKKYNSYFLVVRGCRNLANCYTRKGDFENANREIKEAEKVIEKIADPTLKAKAEFDVTYAKSKICKDSGKPEDAIRHLDHCLELYDTQLSQDKTAKQVYADRLVKIYREKGVIYLGIKSMQEKAIEAFEIGLSHAKNRQNHEDTLRCCTNLIDLQTKYRHEGLDALVPHWIKDAEENLPMVDTQDHVDAYWKAKAEWEKANNGTQKR